MSRQTLFTLRSRATRSSAITSVYVHATYACVRPKEVEVEVEPIYLLRLKSVQYRRQPIHFLPWQPLFTIIAAAST